MMAYISLHPAPNLQMLKASQITDWMIDLNDYLNSIISSCNAIKLVLIYANTKKTII